MYTNASNSNLYLLICWRFSNR